MKIALFGASGRIGRTICLLAHTEPDLSISEAIAHPHSSSLSSSSFNLPITPSFQGNADLLIDVSLVKAFPLPLATALAQNKPIVIGITSLNEEQMEEILNASRVIPIFYSPNFSLGMALLRRLAREVAFRFSSNTVDLIESHHAQKKDSPSGSALLLTKELEHCGINVRIHSIRAGSLIGKHTLLFNADEESLEITHIVHSRNAFARGALAAARFLIQQKPGLYGMDDLLL